MLSRKLQYVKWNVIQLRYYNQNRQLHQLKFIFFLIRSYNSDKVQKTVQSIVSRPWESKLKLGGWQRLWIIVSAVLMIVVGVFTVGMFPTRSELEREWTRATLSRIKDVDKSLQDLSLREIERAYTDVPPLTLTQWVQEKYSAPDAKVGVDFSRVNSEYEGKLASLGTKAGGNYWYCVSCLGWLGGSGLRFRVVHWLGL